MIEAVPNYYKNFKCIAHECKHSCCIGWEIDVDQVTMDFYNSIDGELGERIRENIEGEVPHFVLKEDERCPFLNEKGLCDIITALGEDGLCDICYLHPRFKNFYDDFTETGLGLCCEEAARIILTQEERFEIPTPEHLKNTNFFKERSEVFDILQDRSVTIAKRLNRLSKRYGFDFNVLSSELYDLYFLLERFDGSWDDELKRLKKENGNEIFEVPEYQIFFEQLASYFVFRHFQRGIEFALLSCRVLGMLCYGCKSLEEMMDLARRYSCEVEYSEENTERVIGFLKKDSCKGVKNV